MMSGWDQYFARQQSGFNLAGLRNQLDDLTVTAFASKDSETLFDVLDIDNNNDSMPHHPLFSMHMWNQHWLTTRL